MNLVRRVQNLESRALVRAAPDPERLPVNHPADLLVWLGEQMNAVRADPLIDSNEKARTLGFLSTVALRVMEAGETRARLKALDRVLKLRQADAKDDARWRK